MAEDLMALRQIKYGTDTKKFLREASALIELVNLVDSFRLRKTKLSECCICKVNEHNEIHRHRTGRGLHRRHLMVSKHETHDADVGLQPKLTSWRKATRTQKPALSNFAAVHCKTKSTELNPKKLELKSISKCQPEILKPKILHKEIKNMHREPEKKSQKRSSRKKVKTRATEREIKRRRLTSNLDVTSVRIQSLKNLFGLNGNNKSRKPIVLLPKVDYAKSSSRTKKCYLSDSLLSYKNSTKRIKKKHNSHALARKTVIKKPSLHLMLNLDLKTNSNTIKMQIQSSRKTPKSNKSSQPNVVSIHLFNHAEPAAHQKRINKILKNKQSRKLGTSCTKRATSSIRQSNDQEKRFLKQHHIRYSKVRMPYQKTQAVYNVYDVVPYQQPRQVQGIKSHISFNLNFGNPPQTEQTEYTNETGSINTQNGRFVGKPCQVRYKNKVNYNSGLTSLQQSLSLGRRNPQSETYYPSDFGTEPCDCEPMESEPGLSDDQQTCDTCCQAPIPLSPPPQVDVLETCLTIFKRTKRRIVDRVANVSREASSIVLSPRVFMRRLYDKYTTINNRVEQRLKDEASCTCSPFLDTDQVSVYEDNVEPECSFLKRCFGSLIYNDKCIVCSQEKGVGTGRHMLKPYECAPGVCVEAGGLFSCLTKFCDKYRKGKVTKGTQSKKKGFFKFKSSSGASEKQKLKAKAKKAKQLAKAKAKKELAKKKAREAKRKAREKAKKKKKGSPVCRFLTSIFKKPEDDDQRKLLKKGKYRKHKDGDDEGGRAGETEIERQAKRGLRTGRRHFRRATRRIRERYYRNKKLAEEQKGRFACDFYLLSLRNRPCLWVYYMCPWCYPHCLQALNVWRQVSDLLLFFVAIVVWSPCILATEMLKVMACNLCV